MNGPVLPVSALTIHVRERDELPECLPRLTDYALRGRPASLSRHPAWLHVLQQGLDHGVYCIEALQDGRTRGFVALAFVKSLLFGRFLVSLPYLNTGGIYADDAAVASRLIEAATRLADDLRVRYLELRHEQPTPHASLTGKLNTKVHMRLPLPSFAGQLWKALPSKVRNQVRKGQKQDFTVHWGSQELLPEFYAVFSQTMRDLGTPVYSRRLFDAVLRAFGTQAELCVLRAGTQPIAGALLLHGRGVTEVPSAACLRDFNPACANMRMYYHLLERALDRQQDIFDFGRSTVDSSTYRFKKQWGAEPQPAEWQYYVREGSIGDMRPDHPRYQRAIQVWQKLPVALTTLIGPPIVRGIP